MPDARNSGDGTMPVPHGDEQGNKKITKLITSQSRAALLGVISALLLCEKHEHEFMVAKNGIAVSPMDIQCLHAQGVRL